MTTLTEFEDAEAERESIERERYLGPKRDARGRFMKVCWDCRIYPPDSPRGLCPGCEAYREHLR